jgi:hypothetical protein
MIVDSDFERMQKDVTVAYFNTFIVRHLMGLVECLGQPYLLAVLEEKYW